MSYKIPKQKYISFDIFDTLVRRDVARSIDVFEYVERYCIKNDIEIPNGFCERRREAERIANSRYNGTATLSEIYDELHISNKEQLIEIEIKFEKKLIRPNTDVVNFYNYCIESGKEVVLISDMYLSVGVLSDILNNCGIHNYKKLFVSCECKAKKVDGTLFNLVLKYLNIKSKEIVHYGDNIQSDYWQAKKIGIQAHLVVDKKKKNPIAEELIDEKHMIDYCTVNRVAVNISKDMSEFERCGAIELGPFLYGFAEWLCGKCKDRKIKDVFFFSRDGYLMQKAFDIVDRFDIKSHYLYCSRKAFSIPLLWKCSCYEDIFKYISVSKNMTIKQLLVRIGLDPDKYRTELCRYGLELNQCFYNYKIKDDSKVREFFNSIYSDIYRLSISQFELVKEYLLSFDFPPEFAVVDIGYHGTMQNALRLLLKEIGIESKVYGYYVGLYSSDTFVNDIDNKAEGYLFDANHGIEIEKITSYFTPILESVFLAQHGSVMGYKKDNLEIKPDMEAYEYDSTEKQIINEIDFIKQYQKGAIKSVECINNCFVVRYIPNWPAIYFLNFARLGTVPTYKEAKHWGNLRFFDYSVMYIARTSFNIYKSFKESPWKVGFLKRLIRFPIRYDWLCNKLRELM